MKRRYCMLAALGLASTACLVPIGLSGCAQQTPNAQGQTTAAARPAADPTRVKIVRPVREHLKKLSTPQPGHVEPFEQTHIYAKVSGYLEAFGQVKGASGSLRPLDIGDRVSKGDVLAKLFVPEMDQERLQKAALVEQAKAELGQAEASLTTAASLVAAAKARLKSAEAQVARWQAEQAYRKSEHERYVTLVRDRAVAREYEDEKLNQYRAAAASVQAAQADLASTKAEIAVEEARLKKTEADLASAKSRLEVARVNLQQAVIMLDYATLKAPYDGILTRRLIDTGAFVQSAAAAKAEPLFTLARVEKLRIVAAIPEAEASQVRLGQSALVQVGSGGRPVPAKLIRFADALDAASRTMRTEFELDAPAHNLRLGTFGSVTVVLVDLPDALVLPATALVAGAKPAVMVVKDGHCHRQDVVLGYNDGVRVQVTKGLEPGDEVVAEGKASLSEGQAVTVVR